MPDCSTFREGYRERMRHSKGLTHSLRDSGAEKIAVDDRKQAPPSVDSGGRRFRRRQTARRDGAASTSGPTFPKVRALPACFPKISLAVILFNGIVYPDGPRGEPDGVWMATPKNHSKSTLKVIHPPTLSRAEDWKRWIIPDAVWNKWKSLGLDDDDLNALQICVMMNPKGSPVIPGTGGLRNDEGNIPAAQRAAIKKGIDNMFKWIEGGG